MALYILARNLSKPQTLRNFPIRICAQNIFQTKALNKTERYFFVLDHKMTWILDKSIQASLLAIIPIGLAFPNKLTDIVMITLGCVHSHWSLKNVIVDYVRPLFGISKTMRFVFVTFCFIISSFTYGNLLYFVYNDIGVGRAFRTLWTLNRKKEEK